MGIFKSVFLLILICAGTSIRARDPLIEAWRESMLFGKRLPLDDIQQPLNKEQWTRKYVSFMGTPQWLAEEEFHNCDADGSGDIQGEELRCF